MQLSIDPRKLRDYITAEDRSKPTALQTVFRLKSFTVYEEAELATLADASTPGANARTMIETVRHGLAGWHNLLDPDGVTIEFQKAEDGYAARASIELLPTATIIELFQAILRREAVTKEEAGKS